MTRIWNPYTFTPLGNPIVGEAPPVLRVMGGMQATAQQLSYAQQRFTQFVMQARLSTVPNPTEAGSLPDGTRYRIVKVGPQTTMEIWPGGAAEGVVPMMHGVLREVSEFNETTAGVTRRVLEEFKANGETTYSNVTGFFVAPNYRYLNTPMWQAFARYDLSGPAAVLAQFGRGAVAAYNKYLGANGMTPRAIKDGVVVASTTGGQKLLACYSLDEGGLKIAEMRRIKAPIKGGLPDEISSLFGGAPLPPTITEWATAPTVISYETIRAASGFSSAALWSGLSFPKVASTGNGLESYFIVAYSDPLPAGGFIYKSRLMKLTFSVLPSGEIGAAVTAAGDPGNYDASFVTEDQIPDSGTWHAPFAVTHEGGVLTLFTVEHEFDSYSRPNDTPKKLLARKTLKWPRGEVHTHLEKTYSAIHMASSRGATATLVGTRVETRGTMTITYQKWIVYKSASGNSDYRADDRHFGAVRGVGREGTYYVTKSTWKGYGVVISANFSGSVRMTYDEWYPVRRTDANVFVYDITEQIAAIAAAETYSDSGSLTFPDAKRKLYLGIGEVVGTLANFSIMEPTLPDKSLRFPNDRSFAIGAAVLSSYAGIAANWPDSEGSGDRVESQEKAEFESAKLHANGQEYDIPATDVMALYETPAKILQREKEINFAIVGPLDAINNYEGGQMFVDLSQLGGPQVLFAFREYSTLLGAQRTWKSTWGSLVTDDANYTKTLSGKFVGVLQP